MTIKTNDLCFKTKDEILDMKIGRFPLIVVSENRYSLISAKIRAHTNGAYNHAMFAIKPFGEEMSFVSQDLLLHSIPAHEVLSGKHRLKFWACTNWQTLFFYTSFSFNDPSERLRRAIGYSLELPWYRRLYDFPGILGQWLKLPSINIPSLNYCSEYVAKILRETYVIPRFDLIHPSPADLNRYFKLRSDMRVVARFDPDVTE